jgi:hypothetical protein
VVSVSRHPGYAADIAEDADGMVIHMTVHRVEHSKPGVVIHRQRWQPADRQPLANVLHIAEQAAVDDRADITATAKRHTVKVCVPETETETATHDTHHAPVPVRVLRRPLSVPVVLTVVAPHREPDRQGRRPQASKRRHGRPSRTAR